MGEGVLPYREIADIAPVIQSQIQASEALQAYALDLWAATRKPADFGIQIDGADMEQLVLAGASPRGVSMMMRAARVHAWLEGRGHMIPEDLQGVFRETIAHRIFLAPVYELRREQIIETLMDRLLRRVAAP